MDHTTHFDRRVAEVDSPLMAIILITNLRPV
jgi:hypothetical protein